MNNQDAPKTVDPLAPSEIARELYVSGVTGQLVGDYSNQADAEAHAVGAINALVNSEVNQVLDRLEAKKFNWRLDKHNKYEWVDVETIALKRTKYPLKEET